MGSQELRFSNLKDWRQQTVIIVSGGVAKQVRDLLTCAALHFEESFYNIRATSRGLR